MLDFIIRTIIASINILMACLSIYSFWGARKEYNESLREQEAFHLFEAQYERFLRRHEQIMRESERFWRQHELHETHQWDKEGF